MCEANFATFEADPLAEIDDGFFDPDAAAVDLLHEERACTSDYDDLVSYLEAEFDRAQATRQPDLSGIACARALWMEVELRKKHSPLPFTSQQ